MPTAPMRHEHIVSGRASEVLPRALHVTASSHANSLAAGVGSSNEPLVGFIDFADCGSATSAAGGTLNGYVRDTKGLSA
jgi:hypothetical protein